MKETRLPFTSESILAFQAGRKTQTRRVVRPQPHQLTGPASDWWEWGDYLVETKGLADLLVAHCPYGQPGDIILVTETWRVADLVHYAAPGEKWQFVIEYPSDGTRSPWISLSDERLKQLRFFHESMVPDNRWRLPRYMPKEFVRYRWPLDSLGVERLQDITLADIFAEGMTNDDWYETAPADWFSALWNRLHPECPWESNPWVYVLGLGEASR